MGGMFNNMHHYCWGLTKTNYAILFYGTLKRTPQERRALLNSAIGEFDYVIERAPPDFVLLPEFLTKKGESLVDLGKPSLAAVEFQRAMQLKPDYWPPYVALSDYYKDIGNPKMAREVLERALSFSPDAQAVKRRLAELDGVKAKPRSAAEPAAKPVAEAVR